MQRKKTSQPDPTPAVIPQITHTVPWRIVAVKALPGLCLHVTFVDGREGRVEMKDFLASPKLDGTLFAPLREPEMFARVYLDFGAVTWPTGADLAPDAMYDEIRKNGKWVLGA